MKINKVKITNFKVFDSYLFDFESADFLMFDGPNGFGKTSFYDAIELLITGDIRRYKSLSGVMIDGRTTFLENPYRYSGAPDGDVEIRSELEINGQILFISRKCKNEEIELSSSFRNFKLYHLDSFDGETSLPLEDETNFMVPLLGANYRHNFEFLNYIEQEENAYLLKHKDKDKRTLIGHLFNVEEFETEMSKIAEVRKKISPLFSTQQKHELKGDELRLKELKASIGPEKKTVYKRIFPDIDYPWDAEQINFKNHIYTTLFNEDGILTNLKALIVNKSDFLSYRLNDRIQKICNDQDRLETFLIFSNFVDNKEQYSKTLSLIRSIESFLELMTNLENVDISKVNIRIPETIIALIDDDLNDSYKKKFQELIKIQSQTGNYEKLLSTLMLSRDSLIRNFELFKDHDHDYNPDQCPLCGYSWSDEDQYDNERLNLQIQSQTTFLEELIETSQDEYYAAFELFRDSEVKAVIDVLKLYINDHPIDQNFLDELIDTDELLVADYRNKFRILGINVSDFLKKEPSFENEVFVDDLIEYLATLKKEFPTQNVTIGMRNAFRDYYIDKDEEFEAIEVEDIEKKIDYINWLYHIYQSEAVLSQQESIDDKQLKDLHNIYKSSLEKYSKDLIKDIEILFHIYSGRIMQDFQGGLGLFISNNNGIRFLTEPSKSFDAMFTMSSGQIAALIISFTLALNKKYSAANKILFIDDPVQTMDELNIAGLVELLRNDFADRQIFISTHEDKMSTFMRYKFSKFDLQTKRLNMKLFHKERSQH